MVIDLDYNIERNKLFLHRYKQFNWKKYFLKTFAFLFILNMLLFLIYQDINLLPVFLNMLAISLWMILLVCIISTLIISVWYNKRYHHAKDTLQQLIELKRRRTKYKV